MVKQHEPKPRVLLQVCSEGGGGKLHANNCGWYGVGWDDVWRSWYQPESGWYGVGWDDV
jgi:hypothetical protein